MPGRQTLAAWRWLLLLATVVAMVSLVIVLQRPNIAQPLQHQPKQAGQGAADHATIIHLWADAARRRDYEMVQRLMPVADDWALAYWQARNETQLANGWIDTYSVAINQQGEYTTAVVRWRGKGPKDVCTTVQVNREGRLSVIKEYAWCPE